MRIISILFAVFILAYICMQGWRHFYNPIETVSAVYGEVEDSVPLDGFVVREESVLRNANTGTTEFVVSEGERVGRGDLIAKVFASEDALKNSRAITTLSDRIEKMETVSNQGSVLVDIDTVDAIITETTVAALDKLENNQMNGLPETLDKLKTKTLSRAYIDRDKAALTKQIDALKTERKQYQSLASQNKSSIAAPTAGYFSRSVDGCEAVFLRSAVLKTTPENFEQCAEQIAVTPSDQGVVGKIITNYVWSYAAVVEDAVAQRFQMGQAVTLRFDNPAYPNVPATVSGLIKGANNKTLVVIDCAVHLSNFTQARKLHADVVVKTYSGLKIPREALRVDENGQKGVYCLVDSQVKFKPIATIFEADNYYLVAYDSSNTKGLLLYDEVVIAAKELTHKKIVK